MIILNMIFDCVKFGMKRQKREKDRNAKKKTDPANHVAFPNSKRSQCKEENRPS